VGYPSLVGGDVALLVFVCSVTTGVVAPSYVVDGVKENEWILILRPLLSLYSMKE
jgi:hypothetical protein